MADSQFELRLREILAGYSLPGVLTLIGAETPRVYLKDASGNVMIAAGNVLPTDATLGYAKGCLYFKTDAISGEAGLHVNNGTTLSCLFSASSAAGQSVISFSAVPASGVACHAAVQEGAANAFPGPFTAPTIPRSLDCVFAAGWEGGDVTVAGTNQFDEAVTETFTAVAGTTVEGVKIFKTITSAAKAAVAGTTDTVVLQTGGKIGLLIHLSDAVGLLFANDPADFAPPADCPEHLELDATYHAFTPESVPDGAISFKLICNVA